jgi:hypothetical protein
MIPPVSLRGWWLTACRYSSVENFYHGIHAAYLEETVGDDTSTDIEKQGPLERLKTTAGKAVEIEQTIEYSNSFLTFDLRASFHVRHKVYFVLGAGVSFFTLAFVFAPQTLVFVAGSICMAKWVRCRAFIVFVSFSSCYRISKFLDTRSWTDPKHTLFCIQRVSSQQNSQLSVTPSSLHRILSTQLNRLSIFSSLSPPQLK